MSWRTCTLGSVPLMPQKNQTTRLEQICIKSPALFFHNTYTWPLRRDTEVICKHCQIPCADWNLEPLGELMWVYLVENQFESAAFLSASLSPISCNVSYDAYSWRLTWLRLGRGSPTAGRELKTDPQQELRREECGSSLLVRRTTGISKVVDEAKITTH